MRNVKKFYALILLLATQNIFAAANFSITPSGVIPTTVAPGKSVSAYYTLTNLTNSTRAGYVIQGLPGTVVQNTTAPNCSNPINLAAHASCPLQLDVSGAATAMIAICKGASCTTASAPLSVSVSGGSVTPIVPAIPKFAYVAQYFATEGVQVCVVDPVTGLLSNCADPGGHSVLDNAFPQGIAINSAGTVAYITGYTDNPIAYQCTINRNDGTFTQCTATTITTPTGYNPEYGQLVLNPANTLSFIADAAAGTARILACPITSNAISATCSDTGATGMGSGVDGITLNAAGTTSYMGTYPSTFITTCAVSGSSFSACTNKTGDGTITFSEPSGVALNSTGSILYIADDASHNIYGCSTASGSASLFSSCFIATTLAGPATGWSVTVNAAGTFAYVTDFGQRTYTCPILNDGTFATCTENTSFTDPVDVAFLY